MAFDPGSNYVWNAARLKDPGLQAYLSFLRTNRAPGPEEIFTFRAPHDEPYPLYRYYPGIQTGSGWANRFGWRGPDISAERPPGVIRIGVMGDSTTNTYPGMVEHWLNLWALKRNLGVRFEVINAARPATDALDAAAILDFELAAADPDYAIVYGFGNGIYDAEGLITLPPGVVRGDPSSASVVTAHPVNRVSKAVGATLDPLARRSAAARFLRARVMGDAIGGPIGGVSQPEIVC